MICYIAGIDRESLAWYRTLSVSEAATVAVVPVAPAVKLTITGVESLTA